MKEGSDVDFSPISCLPDDVVLEIFHNKVMDLKTLCLCKLVSKRFYAIVHQVNTIRAVFNYINSHGECEKDDWLMKSISMFKKVKSVCIHIPDYHNHKTRNSFLGKWKVKLGCNKIDYFVMLLPTSIYDNKGLLLDEEKLNLGKFTIAMRYFGDALWRVHTSWRIINLDIPLLEKVTITDSENKARVSVNELTKWKSISSFVPRLSECYLPSLDLPVSRYVMKEVSLVLVENKDLPDDGNFDRFIDDHEVNYDKHNKEEAAYHEAMMEIFKKHKGSILRRPPNDKWVSRISELTKALQRLVELECYS